MDIYENYADAHSASFSFFNIDAIVCCCCDRFSLSLQSVLPQRLKLFKSNQVLSDATEKQMHSISIYTRTVHLSMRWHINTIHWMYGRRVNLNIHQMTAPLVAADSTPHAATGIDTIPEPDTIEPFQRNWKKNNMTKSLLLLLCATYTHTEKNVANEQK